MTRRLQHIDEPSWAPFLYVSACGVALLAAGAVCQAIELVVSIRHREALRDVTGDPWDGRSLEWATPSPAPFFNFATMPDVEGEEAYWRIKERAIETQRLGDEPNYQPIHMPRQSAAGFWTAVFATMTGFGLVWQIWWLVGLGLVLAYAGFVFFAWRDDYEYEVPASQVAEVDRARRASRQAFLDRLEAQRAAEGAS